MSNKGDGSFNKIFICIYLDSKNDPLFIMIRTISAIACFFFMTCWMFGCHSVRLSKSHQNTLNRYVWKTQQNLHKTAQLKSLVDHRIRLNPHSAAKDFYPVLDNVSKKLDKIHQKLRTQLIRREAMPLTEIRKIRRTLKHTQRFLSKTNRHILHGTEQILESDVLFEVGSTQLKAAGVVSLNHFAQFLKNRLDLLSANPMQVKVAIAGYADEQGFVRGETDNQRQEKNRLLSLGRATTVKHYLSTILHHLFEDTSQDIRFDIQVEGKGETLPPKLADPHKNDRRRRICTISCYAVIPTQVPLVKTQNKPRRYTMPAPVKPSKK
ncbi:hypothetical protein BKI52_05015 [marine bacterium AO1-C]|nr:hypothetical protein BKI52_05015 [marine bacterium AO1-C]